MLKPALANAAGTTLIEMMVGIVIFSILLGMAAPSFSSWLQNGNIRTSAESMLSGLQLARAAAVQRNDVVTFRLVTGLAGTCTVSTTGTSWVVSLDDPTNACADAPSDTVAPRILQSRSGTDTTRNAAVTADQSSIGFNGLGKRINAGTAANVNIDVTNPSGGTCVQAGGPMRCLRLVISGSGQVRMCDPASASTDPRAC